MADNDKEDDLYDRVSDMADRLGLEGEERGQYIHEHMTRGGYRAVPQYVREDTDDSGSGRGSGGFFGSKRQSGGRRSSGGDRGDRSRSRGDDDWYNG